MSEACRYIIMPYENGTWRLLVEGENEGPLQFDTKAEAIAYATKAASIHGPCRVVIQHVDGSLDEELYFEQPSGEA